MKKTATTAFLLAGFLASAAPVFADGSTVTKTVCTTQYGGVRECEEVEVTRDEITHPVEETGIVENVLLAGGLFVAGYALLLLVKHRAEIKFN